MWNCQEKLPPRIRAASLMLMTMWSIGGCKPSGSDGAGDSDTSYPDADVVARRSSEVEFYADSRREIKGSSDFFFSVWDQSFTTKLTDLPKDGSVAPENVPYSGHWYPEVSGGTGVKQRSGSALEKYDLAINAGNMKATQWEAANHTVPRGSADAEWAGHCNGWSAAATRHKEPFKNVTRNGVTFEPHDVKALLAEIYMSAKFLFLGGARCEDRNPPGNPSSRPDPTVMGVCEDVNPGSFHASIANWIGKKKYALVFDEQVSYQVWNYPLYAYSSTMQTIDRAEALRRIGSSQTNYVFNTEAKKFVGVTTQVFFAKALGSEPQGNAAPTHDRGSQVLSYVLELNAADEIIGGEWTEGSQRIHPDFVWVPLEPVVATGTRDYGNPHLNPDEVLKIWAESVGLDPNNLPPLLKEPLWIQNWGKFPQFDVMLDGGKTGAVFLGKPVHMEIKRRESLVGNVTVTVSLNSVVVGELSGAGSDTMSHTFEASPGLSRLEFVWKKDGAEVERKSLRFHANP